ncbi:hypothetical protein BS78_03G414500 [Paspalum vaginatum]|nr:hypothetical protein BS78_03G414500 [Paspalum vaginatum]
MKLTSVEAKTNRKDIMFQISEDSLYFFWSSYHFWRWNLGALHSVFARLHVGTNFLT